MPLSGVKIRYYFKTD
ncbi:hypothetical protein ACWCSH_40310, partial [Streptosporangium sp. NPDC001682]